MNNLTKEDIKNSLEYKWRYKQIKVYTVILGIYCVIALFAPLLGGLPYMYLVPICLIIPFALFLVPIIIYYYSKMRYLLKNYEKFKQYEVILDHPATSYLYRGFIYYKVIIRDDFINITVETNPLFNSYFSTTDTLEEYNNKKVIVLYDNEISKAYVIKKVD